MFRKPAGLVVLTLEDKCSLLIHIQACRWLVINYRWTGGGSNRDTNAESRRERPANAASFLSFSLDNHLCRPHASLSTLKHTEGVGLFHVGLHLQEEEKDSCHPQHSLAEIRLKPHCCRARQNGLQLTLKPQQLPRTHKRIYTHTNTH